MVMKAMCYKFILVYVFQMIIQGCKDGANIDIKYRPSETNQTCEDNCRQVEDRSSSNSEETVFKIQEIASSPFSTSKNFDYAIDSNDQMIMIYSQSLISDDDKNKPSFIEARSQKNNQWVPTVRVDKGALVSEYPSVVSSTKSPISLATWHKKDQHTTQIESSWYTAEKGWSVPVTLSKKAGQRTQLSYNPKTNMFWVVWDQPADLTHGIYGARFSIDTRKWEQPRLLFTPPKGFHLLAPILRFREDGSGVLIWKQISLEKNKDTLSIHMARYNFEKSIFTVQEKISDELSGSKVVQHGSIFAHSDHSLNLALEDDVVVATWTVQREAIEVGQVPKKEIWMRLLHSNKASKPQRLSNENLAASFSSIAFNDRKDIMIVWQERRDRYGNNILGAYLSKEAGYEFSKALEIDTRSYQPSIISYENEFKVAYVRSEEATEQTKEVYHLKIVALNEKDQSPRLVKYLDQMDWRGDASYPVAKGNHIIWRQKRIIDGADKPTHTLQHLTIETSSKRIE